MIKKIIVTLLLINTFLFSGNINLSSIKAMPIGGGALITLTPQDKNAKNFPNRATKDWVGVYRKGASNAWENIKGWSWVKDFGFIKDGVVTLHLEVKLQPGEYEVRYFRNNSFTTYKKSSFKVNKLSINLDRIEAFYINGQLLISLESLLDTKYIRKNPKDWIGIYKKSNSNAWGNVIAWIWAKDIKNVTAKARFYREWETLKNVNLQPGEYEVRYFLNNSFATYEKSSFKVEKLNSNLKKVTALPNKGGNLLYITIESYPHKKLKINSKDWIGIYKKGSSNAWGNVITWIWAHDVKNPVPTDDNTEARVKMLNNIHLQPGEYEVRYFLNNSFTTYMKSSFKVAGNDKLNLTAVSGYYKNGGIVFRVAYLIAPKLNNGPKDWVGLYKKGASNDWNNVLIWAWVKDFEIEEKAIDAHKRQKINLQAGEYEVRYFRNNSFTTYMKSSFKVK